MNQNLFIVFVGGGLGSVARYLTGIYVSKFWHSTFPIGTFSINIIGCFIIGVVYGLSEKYGWLTPQLRLLLATGFCGGYTTFSTFALENLRLLQTNQLIPFFLYALLSFVLGLFAVWGGLRLAAV